METQASCACPFPLSDLPQPSNCTRHRPDWSYTGCGSYTAYAPSERRMSVSVCLHPLSRCKDRMTMKVMLRGHPDMNQVTMEIVLLLL